MVIDWGSGPAVLAGMLRRHGQDPEAVQDVEAAWQAFAEFMTLGIDSADGSDDADADGFIIQWNRRTLTFTRQLIIDDQVRQLHLELTVDVADHGDTGFGFRPADDVADLRVSALAHPPVRAAWSVIPAGSRIAVEHAC